jgi:hypothetical protein
LSTPNKAPHNVSSDLLPRDPFLKKPSTQMTTKP